jgi:AraC-like DNA-binding protein
VVNTVPATLRPWISDVRVESLRRSRTLVHPPEPSATLVWCGPGEVRALGPRTHASYFEGKDLPVCVRLRVRPGCTRAVLGVEAGELVDDSVALRELWGRAGRRLDDELAELGGDPAAAVRHLEDVLLQRLSSQPAENATFVTQAVRGLGQPTARVRETARRLGVSERRLRDVFTADVGVSPKHFARITRVQAVLAGAGARPLAQLAGDVGYYDQSHMTAEFRELMHVAPGAYAAGHLPAPAPC